MPLRMPDRPSRAPTASTTVGSCGTKQIIATSANSLGVTLAPTAGYPSPRLGHAGRCRVRLKQPFDFAGVVELDCLCRRHPR